MSHSYFYLIFNLVYLIKCDWFSKYYYFLSKYKAYYFQFYGSSSYLLKCNPIHISSNLTQPMPL